MSIPLWFINPTLNPLTSTSLSSIVHFTGGNKLTLFLSSIIAMYNLYIPTSVIWLIKFLVSLKRTLFSTIDVTSESICLPNGSNNITLAYKFFFNDKVIYGQSINLNIISIPLSLVDIVRFLFNTLDFLFIVSVYSLFKAII